MKAQASGKLCRLRMIRNMKKIFRKISYILGFHPQLLIITLIRFSGAMLVFEDEVNERSYDS